MSQSSHFKLNQARLSQLINIFIVFSRVYEAVEISQIDKVHEVYKVHEV